MLGKRIHPGNPGFGVHECEPGDYYRDAAGDWRGKTPNGLCVFLKNHRVEESADGTITVTPSILTSNGTGNKTWHGFIVSGEWKEC